MKKLFIILVFSASVSFNAQAGYVVNGILANNVEFRDLINYTLTFKDGVPYAAASMHDINGVVTGRNCIVIIEAIQNIQDATYFPIQWYDDIDIIVRDFHYDKESDLFLLCGSRQKGNDFHAFVAEIYGGLSQMRYMEYPEADIFYSICVSKNMSLDYFVCGKKGLYGVVASIDRSSLDFNNLFITDNRWEFHKIIAKNDVGTANPRFIVSGRSTEYPQIGFTVISPNFVPLPTTFYWNQSSSGESHVTLCDNYLDNTKVVMASSVNQSVTLFSVTLSGTPSVSAYQYDFIGSQFDRYCVQDMIMTESQDVAYPRVSVAGFMGYGDTPADIRAWYGEVKLSSILPMDCNDYSRLDDGLYQHFKIKYYQNEVYTGGYFEDDIKMCALFGTPRKLADDCDLRYKSTDLSNPPVNLNSFDLSQLGYQTHTHLDRSPFNHPFIYDYCIGLKKGESYEKEMQDKNEIEIVTFPDYITVINASSHTDYQIYNVVGQLMQAGITNSDISTVQLSKGVYILRLESGKTFKFVK